MLSEIPTSTFFNYFLYLLIPFLFGYAAKKIKISPIIGYVVGGVVLGNALFGIVSEQAINSFAYFGIVLLLFTVGLEINLEKLFLLKKFILLGGGLQILLSVVGVTILSLFFGFSYLQALLIAVAFASSSTTIVAKIIQERGEENSFLGEMAMGILMFQDLAFIPFIILFTNFSGQSQGIGEIVRNVAVGIFESALILAAMYYIGKKVVPILFNVIAKTSRELLNLFIIIFIFMITFVSAAAGVPILIGAFIAGVLVAQTIEHYHIFSQIRPLRDLMAIVFFVFIGTKVDLVAALPLLPQILLFGALVVFIKALILISIFLYFRFNTRIAFSLAIFLFQISETAFILLSLAFANQIFTQEQYLFVTITVLISLMLTPLFINSKDTVYVGLRAFFKKFVPALELFIKHRLDFDQARLEAFDLQNHVVICGYGRIGSHVGKALTLANIPYVAIDYNFSTVEKARKSGVKIIYGDPTDFDVLDFAEAEKAIVLVSAVPAKFDQEAIILNAKKLNSDIFIIGRAQNALDHQRMIDLGVHSVVQPEVEASVSIIKKIFLLKHMPKEEILKRLKHIRLVQVFA